MAYICILFREKLTSLIFYSSDQNFYDKIQRKKCLDQTHSVYRLDLNLFLFCSIFRVMIFAQIWPLISELLILLQTFLLCWEMILCCVKTRFELTDHKQSMKNKIISNNPQVQFRPNCQLSCRGVVLKFIKTRLKSWRE